MAVGGLGANGSGVSAMRLKDGDLNKMSRVLNHGSVSLSENIDMLYNAMYTETSFRGSDKKDEKWLTIGVRPMYYWNDIMSTAVELGYDQVKNAIDNDGTGSAKDSRVSKITVAQQWSAGRGTFARPQIRAFGTYAKWNKDSMGKVGGDAYALDTDGYTFGVQMEAWW
ncbi:MAG: carbohydrate porin [Endozoicomonas sp.]